MLKQKSLGCVLWILAFTSPVAAQTASNIVPDNQTHTSVSYDDTGRALVDIAAPVSDGISHNTFTRFNVTSVGYDFDNRFAGARTIISEVDGE